MRVALASQYEKWRSAFSARLALGTAVLWLDGLNWPMRIDEQGLTLRYRRRVEWRAIRKIGVSRSYLDGHASEIRIHHGGGITKIRVHRMQDGQRLVATILAMFERTNRARAFRDRVDIQSPHGPGVGHASQKARATPHSAFSTRRARADAYFTRELASLRETLAMRLPRMQHTMEAENK